MKIKFYSLLAFFLSLPMMAMAQNGSSSESITLPNPAGLRTVDDLLAKVINWLYVISAPVITIIVIWAAFLMLTANDNKNQFEQGKKMIKNAAIGAGVIICASGLVFIIREFFGVNP